MQINDSSLREDFQHALEHLLEQTFTFVHVINPMTALANTDKEHFDPEVHRKVQKNRQNQANVRRVPYRGEGSRCNIDTVVTTTEPAARDMGSVR